MALNCIVDDSALIAGTRDNAKFSLRQWVDRGAINVFVPLHALERLNALRDSSTSVSQDATKALEWLDNATERYGFKSAGRVQLQGPDDQYMTWQEVEKYSLPDTPLSSNRELGNLDDLSRVLGGSLHLGGANDTSNTADSGSTSTSHPSSASPSPEQRQKSRRGKSSSFKGIPEGVRPLLNFVVWRTHHVDDSLDNSGSYMLMTNDHVTQKQAQKFGVRAKMMSQVAGIVARDASKRNSLQNEASTDNAPGVGVLDSAFDEDFEVGPDHIPPKEGDEYDEEIIFKGRQNRPGCFEAREPQTLMDPDSFGRNTTTLQAGSSTTPNKTTQSRNESRSNGRGNGPGAARRGGASGSHGQSNSRTPNHGGRGQSGGKARGGATSEARSRSQSSPQANSGSKIPTGPAASQRGGFSPRSRAAQPVGRQARTVNIAKPIDPDSYARPATGRGRGRGANQHRLWEPAER